MAIVLAGPMVGISGPKCPKSGLGRCGGLIEQMFDPPIPVKSLGIPYYS